MNKLKKSIKGFTTCRNKQMNAETREKTFEDGTVVIQRIYEFYTGMQMWCPAKSCVFCKHCTDVWFDSDGPYMYACLKEQSGIYELTDKGHVGKCKYFDDMCKEINE